MTTHEQGEALLAGLTKAGFDAEWYYSGGGIEVINVVTRRDDPRPVTRMGKPTGEVYGEPLDYLTLGDPSPDYPDEPFGFDINRDGEYAEASQSMPWPQMDVERTLVWFRDLTPAGVARLIADAKPDPRCEGCSHLVEAEGTREGVLVEEGGDIPAQVWCLVCIEAMTDEQRALTHDDAVPSALHTCVVDEASIDPALDAGIGFCRWCGIQMLHTGSAGFLPVTVLDID